ncbi:MAG: FHA domain-containing protein, partial [Polyangiaceae bacterium]|nr:FHA domain-containing protein [Polyangiaceae bacterium]
MPLKVVVLTPEITPPPFLEAKGRRIILGRDPQATVSLPDPSISTLHASLKKRGKDYIISDEGSTNGTFILGADQ